MKTSDFECLVRRLEADYRRAPGRYRLKLMLMAGLGYGYLLMLLGILLGLLGLLVWLFVASRGGKALILEGIVVVGALIFMVVRATFIRVEPPAGRALLPEDAPELFEELDRMCQQLRCPRPDHVLVDNAFNALMAAVPRFGFLGWPQHHLVVGLPLMAALRPDEFRSVLAHELGHYSEEHGRFGVWIYRVRRMWGELMEQLGATTEWTLFLFQPFLKWYAPRFAAWSFVLVREQEFEADAVAAALSGPEVAGRALIRTRIAGETLDERFWKPLWRAAPGLPQPPQNVFVRLCAFAGEEVPPEEARAHLGRALREKSGFADTHPSLTERLNALSQSARLPGLVTAAGSAARHYLGRMVDVLAEDFGRAWAEAMAPHWAAIAAEQQEVRRCYEELKVRRAEGPLPPNDLWRLALAVEDYEGAAAARPHYLEIVRSDPEHLDAAFALGRIELDAGSELGVTLLKKVYTKDARYGLESCARIIAFYREREEEAKARAYLDDLDRFQELMDAAQRERQVLSPNDQVDPHGLEEAALENLRRQLAGQKDVVRAWLVRKRVRHFPDQPVFVMAVERRRWFGILDSEDKEAELVHSLAQEMVFPGETFVITRRAGGQGAIWGRVKKVARAPFYQMQPAGSKGPGVGFRQGERAGAHRLAFQKAQGRHKVLGVPPGSPPASLPPKEPTPMCA